jgi:hypothetical protein
MPTADPIAREARHHPQRFAAAAAALDLLKCPL